MSGGGLRTNFAAASLGGRGRARRVSFSSRDSQAPSRCSPPAPLPPSQCQSFRAAEAFPLVSRQAQVRPSFGEALRMHGKCGVYVRLQCATPRRFRGDAACCKWCTTRRQIRSLRTPPFAKRRRLELRPSPSPSKKPSAVPRCRVSTVALCTYTPPLSFSICGPSRLCRIFSAGRRRRHLRPRRPLRRAVARPALAAPRSVCAVYVQPSLCSGVCAERRRQRCDGALVDAAKKTRRKQREAAEARRDSKV